jgi:hypothetical protein
VNRRFEIYIKPADNIEKLNKKSPRNNKKPHPVILVIIAFQIHFCLKKDKHKDYKGIKAYYIVFEK